ncbi:MAG: universal stress protein [Haloarculaceae archaeon]
MPNHVLVPYDGSRLAEEALEFAAERFGEAHLTLLQVLDPMTAAYEAPFGRPSPGFWETWYEDVQEAAAEELESAAASVADDVAETETVVALGKPADVILDVCEDEDYDHVVMGSHGREGLSRLFLGSVAEAVIRRAPVPVTVVR